MKAAPRIVTSMPSIGTMDTLCCGISRGGNRRRLSHRRYGYDSQTAWHRWLIHKHLVSIRSEVFSAHRPCAGVGPLIHRSGVPAPSLFTTVSLEGHRFLCVAPPAECCSVRPRQHKQRLRCRLSCDALPIRPGAEPNRTLPLYPAWPAVPVTTDDRMGFQVLRHARHGFL